MDIRERGVFTYLDPDVISVQLLAIIVMSSFFLG